MVELLLALLTTLTGIERTIDADLTALAQRRAVEIQSNFSHQGVPPNTAEIIAWNSNPDPVTRLAAQWQASPPHWAILTDPQYTRWGCGISQKGAATYGVCLFANGAPVVAAPLPVIQPTPSPPIRLLPNVAMETPMPKSEMTVEIKADTRQLDQALRRAQSQLWWMRYGDVVTYAALLVLLAFAVLVGVVLS